VCAYEGTGDKNLDVHGHARANAADRADDLGACAHAPEQVADPEHDSLRVRAHAPVLLRDDGERAQTEVSAGPVELRAEEQPVNVDNTRGDSSVFSAR
jgi:hypothetical protein